jgi:hypothetical protein
LRRLFGLILVLAFALRAHALDADPPANLTFSLSPYTDEGFMVQNAKSKLLFGAWLLDDFFRMAVSPLFSLIAYLNFRLFGVGFVQARMVSVLFGVASVALVFALLRRERSALAGLIGSALLATSYLFTMHQRMALEETSMLFFVLVSVWFLTRPAPRPWQFLCAGLAAAVAAFFLKLSGIFLLPVLFGELLRQRFWVEDSPLRALGNRPLVFAALGVGLGFACWVLFVIVPFGQAAWLMVDANTIHSQGGKPASLLSLIRLVFTLGTTDRLVMRAPGVFFLAGWALLALLVQLPKRLREPASLEVVLAGLTLTSVAMLSVTIYRPLRYQLTLLLPSVLWAALTADRLWTHGSERPVWSRKAVLLAAPVIAVLSYNFLFAVYSAWGVKPPTYGPLLPQALVVAALAVAGWWWAGTRASARAWPLARTRALVAGVLALGIGFDLYQYGSWSLRHGYELVTLSRDLRRLPAGSLIAGPWSASATLETSHRALPMQEYLHTDRVLERFPVTHLVIFEGGWEERFFQRAYPEVLARSRLLESYPIAGKRLFLFQLPER